MLRVLDFRSDDLPPTRTYGKRSWLWIPADRGYPEWDRRLGNLTLKLQHARTGWGRAIEVDTYAVVEEPLVGIPGRKFLLLNLTDPDQPDVYECIVGPQPLCTCMAGTCCVPGEPDITEGCKHRDAIAVLVDEGILDDDTSDAERCGQCFPDDVVLI